MKKKTQTQPSRSKLTVLRQLCNWIPLHLVRQLAQELGVGHQARTFSHWSQMVGMLYAQWGDPS
jgi:hypothetical protein